MSDYMIQKADDQIEAGINERDALFNEIEKLKKQLQHCKNQRDAWINSYTSIPEQIISRENKELEEIVK